MPAAVRPMMLFSIVLPVASAPVTIDAGPLVRRDHVAVGRRQAADLIVRGVVDANTVSRVAGLAVAEDITTPRGRADVVGLDQIPGGTDSAQLNAIAVIGRDDVARPGDSASDHVARRIDDARRIARRARRLDGDSVRAVAGREIKPAGRRPDDADLVAQDLVARCAGLDQDTLLAIAADDVGVLGFGATDRRVGRAQQDPFLRVAQPRERDRVRRRQRHTRQRVDRVDQVISDRVALDQIAHIAGDGD